MNRGRKLLILIIFLQIILILPNISLALIENSLNKNENIKLSIFEFNKQFSKPMIIDNNGKISIKINETNSYIRIEDKPILPIFIKTYEFPLGSKIKKINYKISEKENIKIQKQILTASAPFSIINYENFNYLEENKYNVNYKDIFPESWYSLKLSGGLNRNNEPTTFLAIQLNPIRYNKINNNLQFVEFIKLEILVEEPLNFFEFPDEYDLIIISFDGYIPLLEPLVSHKNKIGIKTKLVGLKDIYNGNYFPVKGRDNQEKIKYFIKDARENWGIIYVMLVGNFRKIPIRYSNLETDVGGTYEELKFISDLYYADIYNSQGNYSSWDTDFDGIYGEWPDFQEMEDKIDLSPDVHLGRLACMFGFEVITMVNKIIDYELNAYGSIWFKNMIVCGGDTFHKKLEDGTNYDEGEIANSKALEYMKEFNHIKLWASLGNLTTANIQKEISNGAGFLYFVGHGNPEQWATHENCNKNWTEGIRNRDIYKLTNRGMYPILMVGGCHNSEFDVTPLNLLKNLRESWYFTTWVSECWSWVFVKKNRGGAIASIGSTGYGGVNVGDHDNNQIPDCIEGADGWFETQFFRIYNEEKIIFLGETYGSTVTDYINFFPVFSNRYDCKIVETHVLFGDPSLKIGGYDNNN